MSKTLNVREIASPSAITVSDDLVIIDPVSLSSIQMPSAKNYKGELIYITLKAGVLKKVSLLPATGELIKGATSFDLTTASAERFISDGKNWY